MNRNLKTMVATALGIALFVVLALCLQVPVFENYYLCLGYIAMAVYCYSFGTVSGTIVGMFGVVLYCLLTSGLRGMPGWALGNVVIGFGLGLTFELTKNGKNRAVKYVLWIAAVILSTAIGILGMKSLVDSVIKSQPFWARVVMNLYAFVADAAVLIVALPICEFLDRPAQKLLKGPKTEGKGAQE